MIYIIDKFVAYFGSKGYFKWINDKKYLQMYYYACFHKKLNLNDPLSFNEKMQWLKLYDRKLEYSILVDKCEAKHLVQNLIGEKYIIPTYNVWNYFDEIDFTLLPEQFVLKTTHDSGGIVIVKDKSTFDMKGARKKINKSLSRNFFYIGREWPYKSVKPRIIAEKYMVDESGVELKDYKVFCFGGEPKYIQVDYGRFTNHERNLYSTNWEYMGFSSMYPTNKNNIIPRPACLDEMLDVSRKLAIGTPFLRVDLYVINKSVYFGELTLYHGGGFEKFYPPEWDRILGDLITLPTLKSI